MIILKVLGSIVISASIIGAIITSMEAFQDKEDLCIGVLYILIGLINLLGLAVVIMM